MTKVDGDMIGTYDGVIRVLWENKGKTIYLTASGCEDDRFISLNDCLKEIEYNGKGVCIVIIDDTFSGKCYQFGNYEDNCWYEYGETMGYA